jgi:hypothetical protein
MDADLRTVRANAMRGASTSLSEILEAAGDLLEDGGPLPDGDGYLELMRSARAAGVTELRRAKRLRLLEIAARDLTGEIALEEVGRALSDLADACLTATLEALDGAGDVAVAAAGKLGARVLYDSSDLDVLVVATGDPPVNWRAVDSLITATFSLPSRSSSDSSRPRSNWIPRVSK